MTRGLVNFTIHVDLSGLETGQDNLDKIKNQVLEKMATETRDDIKDNWSPSSPSSPGQPPAVVTGDLDKSMTARADGADWIVKYGMIYGTFLEFGTPRMAARPFMRPAAERASRRIPDGITAALFTDGML